MRYYSCLMICLLMAAGCQTTTQAPPRSHVMAEPCSEQLHEICGQLLLYYAHHHALPPSVDDLRSMPDADPAVTYRCPVTHQPYVYHPAGLPCPNRPGRIIFYDSRPSESKVRWVIVVESMEPGEPLITRVLPIPETVFPAN
jgi:hypothetical protein